MNIGSFSCAVKVASYLLASYIPWEAIWECSFSWEWILGYSSFDVCVDLSQSKRDLEADPMHPCWILHSTKCLKNLHLWV